MVKHIEFTKHAQLMLSERLIRLEWVEQVMAAPERSIDDPFDSIRKLAFARIAEFGNRWLRVVYVETDASQRIITAFFDRGEDRRKCRQHMTAMPTRST